jgi:hydroxyethylthiazole kinase-like uncharacterized protein yjeF
VPALLLMENAGICTAGAAINLLGGDASGKTVGIVCGKGNNGGDGFVAARHLANSGAFVILILAGNPDELTGDALTNYGIIDKRPALRKLGGGVNFERSLSGVFLHVVPKDDPAALTTAQVYLIQADLVIDAVFGTGLDSEIRGFYRDVIELCNQPGKPVLSVDVPSGVHSDTGEILGAAVRADTTVTFGAPKVGMMVYPGAEYCGEITTADICLPQPLLQDPQLAHSCLTREEVAALLPERHVDAHKGTFGKVLTVGGSVGMTGAGAMASESALRVGAGLSYYALPAGLNLAMEARLTEVITRPLLETSEGSLAKEAFERIAALAEACDAVAIGPGVSTNPETVDLVTQAIAEIDKPMVVDADGLLAFHVKPSPSEGRRQVPIITPHPGEMARLLGIDVDEVQKSRLAVAKEAAQRFRAIVVLKGAGTIVADPAGQVYVNTTGNPGMATAGSGDVLTGAIAGLLAQGVKPLHAAAIGAFLHGLAGDLAAEELGRAGMIAGDIMNALPKAICACSGA